jgi:hypothetical protein
MVTRTILTRAQRAYLKGEADRRSLLAGRPFVRAGSLLGRESWRLPAHDLWECL